MVAQREISNFRSIGAGVWSDGPPNIHMFGEKGRGCLLMNPHTSWASGTIFNNVLFLERGFHKESKSVIISKIGAYFGSLTF